MRGVIKKDIKLFRKYGKLMKISPTIIFTMFLKSSPEQQAIDRIAMEATIWLKQKQKKGEVHASKKGKVGKRITDKLIQEFIKERYGDVKNMPKFFSTGFKEISKLKEIKPKKIIKKDENIIEAEAPDYLDKE